MKKNKKHYDKYKKFDVVYADFGRNPHGVQGGIRPGIVVSCDASNHGGAPQISVVPLSSKLKDNPVHVIVEPSEIRAQVEDIVKRKTNISADKIVITPIVVTDAE